MKKIKGYIEGSIALDISSKKYRFVSNEKEFLISCGTSFAIEINQIKINGRVEYNKLYKHGYYYTSDDNKLKIGLDEINNIHWIDYEEDY